MVTKEATGEAETTRIILVALITLAIVLGFILVPGAARVVLGISLIVFIPGFTMVYALFHGDEIDDIERVALSIGLSICLVIFDGLLLNFTAKGLTLNRIVLSLAAISGVFTAVGYFRRR